MSIGYTMKTVRLNREADQNRPGVKLGKFCIDKNIPVMDVADFFGVTRQTVYNWYIGQCDPKGQRLERIEKYLNKVSR